jgi:hypothetical protein
VPKAKLYHYNITWVHLAGEDPDRRFLEAGVIAASVPRACAKVLGDLNEGGYDRKDVRIIDAQNMDIA